MTLGVLASGKPFPRFDGVSAKSVTPRTSQSDLGSAGGGRELFVATLAPARGLMSGNQLMGGDRIE